MIMTDKLQQITSFLNETYPEVGCELNYTKDYELVIAVMLSAQTTDAAVNAVTKVLFANYDSLEKLANANLSDIEDIIHSIGLYKNKASHVIGIAQTLLNEYSGVLPSDKDLLQTLPGVGNKSAGVIRAEVFKIPDLPVDTHILRISKRLGLAKQDDGPYEVEMKLKKKFPQEDWIKLHHQLIHFGRDICVARKPDCQRCKLGEFCKDFRK